MTFRFIAPCMAVLTCAGTAPANDVTFEDVTQQAKLDYLHWDAPACDPCDEMRRHCGGAAAGDYDNDGWVDLYVTRHQAPNLLFRNQGDGTFVDVAATAGVDVTAYSSGCAWADVDDDGDLDLYVITLRNGSHLFINDGAGRFVDEAATRGIFITESDDESSIAFGDYDRDGWLDAHITDWRPGQPPFGLFHNDGEGFFTDVSQAANLVLTDGVRGFSSGFADINADDAPDLLIAADFGTSRLYRNNDDGTFTNITDPAGVGTDENGMGSAIGDIDNDGDFDWFVTSIYDPALTCETLTCNWGYSGNRLYVNDGTGSFSDGTDAAGVRAGHWGWGASFFDYDNDGDLDLGMTNGVVYPQTAADDAFNADPIRLWENDGTGVMTEVSADLGFTDTGSGKGFVVLDYDRDGDLDVFIANNADTPVLYRNNGGNKNAWLRVRLRGTATNRFGIGATVRVQASEFGPTQTRLVHANSNYQSHDELTAHFGLGPGVDTVYRVTVEWPVNGEVQLLENVTASQVLVITEPPLIPTGSAWSLVVFVLLLLAAGSALLRRQPAGWER